MTRLPWPEGSFDVGVSFNGLWAGGDAALAELVRVVRPRGLVCLSFFGEARAQHFSYLAALGGLLGEAEVAGSVDQLAICEAASPRR